jgi:hypothetical protein
LNKWVDSVPDHRPSHTSLFRIITHLCSVRWDPNKKTDTFFNQSVYLYATYYHIQIIIHRPFIPSPSRPSPLSFPSLAICTNAARSCSYVVDIHRKRNRKSLLLITQVPVDFLFVCVLLSVFSNPLIIFNRGLFSPLESSFSLAYGGANVLVCPWILTGRWLRCTSV